MTSYYLNTSALIKHYVAETGSAWINDRLFKVKNVLLLTSCITMVEVWSALARRRREASISAQHHTDKLDAFREDTLLRYRYIELELPVIETAGRLLERHPLRAYDSVQLASALVSGRILTDAALPQPIFLSADNNLLMYAQAEGLLTDNPNHHE
ncbi:MAG: type II toxin-antitoxin system VapC family toxin [Anaerolineales bacterium]|nr:type II toxin-antitoxin system VapC family toxin [Anaerolineales bacterium]